MEKKAMAVRERNWYQTITAARQSGQTIRSWCAENGVAVSSFYSWQKKIQEELLQQSQLVEFEELPAVPVEKAKPSAERIVIRIRDISAELPVTISASRLSEIIRSIRSAG